MITRQRKFLRRFRREEDGSAFLIEFCLFVPLIFTCFIMSVELGVYAMRNMFLDRGLDIAVRYVRLNTDEDITHPQMKSMICANAGFIEDCEDALRLEMVPVDPRAFSELDPDVDCVDLSEPIQPVRGFQMGREHELMLLRACVVFEPIFPSTGIGYASEKDGSGRMRMVSASAFVQEPN